MRFKVIGLAGALLLGCASAMAAGGPRVLFLNKSAGYEHAVVKVENGKPCLVETVIRPLIEKEGGTLTSTKDGGVITAENLKNYDVVMFYTTGDLCKSDTGDKTPGVGPHGMMDLINWVKAGGGFMGFHCASDTWHRNDNQYAPNSPYLDMLGGEFRTHGGQFVGTVKVVDPKHPVMAHVMNGWQIKDEWYLFTNLQDKTMHVLALMDPGPERMKQDKYKVPTYPVIWCSAPGKGRVLYDAQGHRDDVWTNPDFQKLYVDILNWVDGKGATDAAPNFHKVVPPELDPKTGEARKATK